jgi:hypothetical protein
MTAIPSRFLVTKGGDGKLNASSPSSSPPS